MTTRALAAAAALVESLAPAGAQDNPSRAVRVAVPFAARVRLARKVLGEVATVAQPDTILTWYRKLVARKFDGSKARQSPADRGSRERSSS
jgi:hypothetical protein